jgi:hypothetical protein
LVDERLEVEPIRERSEVVDRVRRAAEEDRAVALEALADRAAIEIEESLSRIEHPERVVHRAPE